jgi:ParB-like chromosome segregation protein Spo0J
MEGRTMKIVYDIHPAANLFPMMDDEAFAALKADIATNGLRESIVLWKNKLVDGRNRLKACEELGIQPGESELDEDQDPIAYVVSANLHRRHLTTSQRAEIAAKLATKGRGGDRKSEKIKGSNGPLKIDDAAKLLNVSPKSVKRAKAKEQQKHKPKSVVQNSAEQKQDARSSGKPKTKRDHSNNAAKQESTATLSPAEIREINSVSSSATADLRRAITMIHRAIPRADESCLKSWLVVLHDIEREVHAGCDPLVDSLESNVEGCDGDAIRSRFSAVKLDGVWIPALDGAIFMGVDNAFSTKRAATESVEYWREKCANDSQEFERISENAKRYREAASGAHPVIEEGENDWYVILPDMTDHGPYRNKRDAESRAQSLRNQFAGGADK